ncbi:hypothetical protein Hanom_Chr12g01102231 [Helianthus anomalus]
MKGRPLLKLCACLLACFMMQRKREREREKEKERRGGLCLFVCFYLALKEDQKNVQTTRVPNCIYSLFSKGVFAQCLLLQGLFMYITSF